MIIDLDGPAGFTSSFLEEVFGGVVRTFGPSIVERVAPRSVRRPSRADKASYYTERAIEDYGKASR